MFQFPRGLRLLAAIAMVAFAVIGILADGSLWFARAQDEMSVEFREPLGGHGRWINHPRWGEVWIPAAMPGDWQPYRWGHWVYTDEWGWYWVADEEWGWITYHYGRWVLDRDFGLGWIWVPGSEWSPAWVSWRQGDEVIGWAPMPPDEIYIDVQDDPDFWLFVRAPDIIAPAIAVVVLPSPQAVVFVHQTVIINQTAVVQGNNRVIVANPGVPPSFVAAKIGRPIQTVSVQPYVIHGTVGVAGAIVGGPPDGAPLHEVIKPRAKLIQPAINAPMASHTSSNQPPTSLQRNQPNLQQPSWGAAHQSPPPPQNPQSNAVIHQLPTRPPLVSARIHQPPPPQHAAPQQQRRPSHY
jgi:hypothetical protein